MYKRTQTMTTKAINVLPLDEILDLDGVSLIPHAILIYAEVELDEAIKIYCDFDYIDYDDLEIDGGYRCYRKCPANRYLRIRRTYTFPDREPQPRSRESWGNTVGNPGENDAGIRRQNVAEN